MSSTGVHTLHRGDGVGMVVVNGIDPWMEGFSRVLFSLLFHCLPSSVFDTGRYRWGNLI